MKFQVTYVHVTKMTRRRAGKSQTVVVDTASEAFASVSVYDKDQQPLAVERIFQGLNSSERSEVKVVDVREVADAEEAIAHAVARRFIVAVIAGDQERIAYEELTRLADADLASVVVDQADLVARHRVADRPRAVEQLGRRRERVDARLGRAVEVVQNEPETLHEAPCERPR